MIQNPNSCGQGYDADHTSNEYHETITAFGYVYSHSTIVSRLHGPKFTYHTYKRHNHCVGTYSDTPIWDTSTGPPSGRMWSGKGIPELKAHLTSKARRYVGLKP